MANFQDLADQVAAGARAVVHSQLNGPDMRRVLRFLSKVTLVLDQAVEDVLALAIDLAYVRDAELTPERVNGFQRDLELLLARSHFRDVEEICSRLGMLREQYESHLKPLLANVDTESWGQLFSLIDEREGYVVYLVSQSVGGLKQLLGSGATAAQINSEAVSVASKLRQSLVELRQTTNSILGLSGSAGLMELTATSRGSTEAPLVEVYDMSHSKHVSVNNASIGNLVVADMIQNSLNTISKIEDQPLKDALKALATQVDGLVKRLPPDDAELAGKRLKRIADESTASKPDPDLMQVSAKGLIEAAKAVAGMVPPITTAVKGVLSILGIAIPGLS